MGRKYYIIGDFCYRSDKGPVWYLKRLPGKKYLIMRNRRNAYNAATCINNYTPSTLEEIISNNQRFVEENPLCWRNSGTGCPGL